MPVSIIKKDNNVYSFLCNECQNEAFTIKLDTPFYSEKQMLSFEGITHSRAISLKYSKKIFKMIEICDIKKLHKYLVNKKILDNGIDAYCPECDSIYCRIHYHANAVIDDEGFYDYTSACCPKMHERIIDD